MLELAIFGALAIAALGVLIRVGMQMNYDQEIRMAAFRRALVAAKADNGTDMDAMGTLFHYIADRQFPSPSDGFMGLLRERTEASAFVEWGDRLTFAHEIDKGDGFADSPLGYKTQPLVVVRSNDQEMELRQHDFPDDISFAGGTLIAARGIERAAWTHNVTDGTITQTGTGSQVGSTTTTTSDTMLNVRGGAQKISSSISSSAGASW